MLTKLCGMCTKELAQVSFSSSGSGVCGCTHQHLLVESPAK